MQSQGNTIFVGIKINDKLREQLDSSNASMKPFFADNDPEHLQIVQVDEDEYIGKVIASGVALETLSNMRMNVKTMVQMICPKFTFMDSALKVLALAPTSVRSLRI
ncbi:hypothetical protein HUU05_19290 [candidate division KSB1 bacterium]|nr:hypothetical protein [candidate division KSB1 bacterium]